MPVRPEVTKALQARYDGVAVSDFRGDTRIRVRVDDLPSALSLLKEDWGFDLLVDLTCVDYLHYRGAEARFGLVYLLASVETAERITIRVFLDESRLQVATATGLWSGADWLEREVWDMYGVVFAGHPDLSRILMPEDWDGHPLRKDDGVGAIPVQFKGAGYQFFSIVGAIKIAFSLIIP